MFESIDPLVPKTAIATDDSKLRSSVPATGSPCDITDVTDKASHIAPIDMRTCSRMRSICESSYPSAIFTPCRFRLRG